MTKVKICGITTLDDALSAVEAGADALGFVFTESSPRSIPPETASEIIEQLPPFVQTVGLFVDLKRETVNAVADYCGLDIVQLHGNESPEFCRSIRRRVIKAFRIKDSANLDLMQEYDVSAWLLDAWSPDAHGGTGRTFNWDIAAAVAEDHHLILAGGLTPENVAEAVRRVRPYAVDVSSGVESVPGRKDIQKMRRFITAAREVHED